MPIHFLRAAASAAALLPVIAAAASLTLDQALDLAVQRSETIRSAHAGAAGAAEAAQAAGQLPDPSLSVGIDNLPVTGGQAFSTTADSMTMKRIGISQEWVPADKRAARRAAARATAGRDALVERAAAAETRLQTALAYLDAYYAGETLKLTLLAGHHLHEELEAATGRLASSAGTGQEALASTSARGAAEDDSDEARQADAASRIALQRWTGQPPDELEAPAPPSEASEEAYVAAHPAVQAARRDIEVARREAEAAATERKPNWTWQVSYGQRTGYPDMVSVGVSIPLQVAPAQRQDRQTAARLAVVEKADADLAEAQRAATAEYRTLASDRQRLAARIDRYRAAVVLPAQQRTQAATAGYRSNQASLATLFEARHMEVEVQRKLLALRHDLASTQARLAYKPLAGGDQ